VCGFLPPNFDHHVAVLLIWRVSVSKARARGKGHEGWRVGGGWSGMVYDVGGCKSLPYRIIWYHIVLDSRSIK